MATYPVMRSWTTEKADNDEFVSNKLNAMSKDGWRLEKVETLRHEDHPNGIPAKVQYIFEYRFVDSGR